MKDAEDEAFDELAKRQGMWGGGFQAKRAAAADKLVEDLAVYGTLWSKNGERIDPMSVYLDEPAQKPVAWTLLLTGEHHGIIGKAGEKFIGAPECYQRVNVYTAPPKREWVGLTDEEILALVKTAPALDTAEAEWLHVVRAAEQSLKEKNT